MEKPAGAACEKCPRRDAKCVLPEPASRADGTTKLVVLSEAPGRFELEKGRPLIGPTGKEIERQLWRHAGLRREDVHWTNAILCDGSKQTLAAARKACHARLVAEVNATGAPVVAAIAGLAVQSSAGMGRAPSILRYRGSVIELDDPLRGKLSANAIVLPMVQPDFVRRRPEWEPVADADYARLGRVLRSGFKRIEEQAGRRSVIVRSYDELLEYLDELGPIVALDVETTDLLTPTVRLVCMVLADEKLAVVIPWSKTLDGSGKFFNGHHKQAAKAITAALKRRVSVTHNGPAFDFLILERNGITLGEWEDSMLGYHALTSHFPKNLSHVARCYLDVPPWKEWDHAGSLERLWAYNARDGFHTRLAWPLLQGQMDETEAAVYEADKKSALLCSTMSRNGFYFDQEHARKVSGVLRLEEERLKKQAAELLGVEEINLLSPPQLHDAFFRKLKAKVYYKSESGKASLGAPAMVAYAASSNERLAKLALTTLEYRRVRKCRATYVDRIKVYPDGRVRPTWKSTGTVSGRWSAADPNLANLPRPDNDPSFKAGLGGIRSLYITPPGRKLVAFDVKQAEYRLAAYLTNDKNMIAACSGDVHKMNASLMFGEQFDKVAAIKKAHKDCACEACTAYGKLRTMAKTSCFAALYLSGAPTVQEQLATHGIDMSLRDVETGLLSRTQRMLKTYYNWQADSVMTTIRTGYVETPILRRKRFLGHEPEASAVANFPVQGGVAEVFSAKAWEIEQRIQTSNLDSMTVGAVYDAGYYDVLEKDADTVSQIITEVWEEPVRIGEHDVVFPIDLHSGYRWSEL